MLDIQILQVPVEAGLELGAVVGLNDHDPEGEPTQHLVDELDGRDLVAPVEDLEHVDALEELDVHLQPMTQLGLLTALPALLMGAVLLVGRQPAQAAPHQDPVNRRGGDRDLVKALQVVGDPAGAEVIVLP